MPCGRDCVRQTGSRCAAATSSWPPRAATPPPSSPTQSAAVRQAVRNVLRAFERRGLAVVTMQSRRPHTAAKVFDAERSERLKALLPQSPRQFGKARSTWTLALAAAVCAEHGITAEPVSYETIRDALKRLGVGWRRAKTWITSPDPQYALKKTGATA